MIVPHTFKISRTMEFGRDSRMPDGLPGLEGTEIATLAAACQPGRTILLGGEFPAAYPTWESFHVVATPGAGNLPSDYATWGSKVVWDRVRKVAIQLGTRTDPSKLATMSQRLGLYSYSASDHRFTHLNNSPHPRIDRPHAYSSQAIDDTRNIFYFDALPDRIAAYSIVTDKWDVRTLVSSGVSFPLQSGVAYHEGIDRVLTVEKNGSASRLWGYESGDDRWREIGLMGHSGYHAMFHYNRIRGDALMVGGNDNPQRVTLVSDSGVAAQMQDAPTAIDGIALSLGMQHRHLGHDPISGNYLIIDRSERVIWEYSPDIDEWRVGKNYKPGQPHASDWPGAYYGHPFTALDELGVILWIPFYGPRLYKHVSVFT